MPPDATRLFIELMEIRDHNDLKLQEEIEFIKKELGNKGLRVSQESYNTAITSGIFSPSEENIKIVDEVERKLHKRHPDIDVSRDRETNVNGDIVPGSKGLPFVISLFVNIEIKNGRDESDDESTKPDPGSNESVSTSIDSHWENENRYEETESDSDPKWRAFDSGSSSQRECPECGGETERSKQSDETVCTECGFLLEASDSSVRGLDVETTEFESDEERSDDDGSPPETVDEWEMWYPCPTCGSTKLNQIIESHLYVSATEDGSYGGEQGGVDEYNYIECGDCGEVLLDETEKISNL